MTHVREFKLQESKNDQQMLTENGSPSLLLSRRDVDNFNKGVKGNDSGLMGRVFSGAIPTFGPVVTQAVDDFLKSVNSEADNVIANERTKKVPRSLFQDDGNVSPWLAAYVQPQVFTACFKQLYNAARDLICYKHPTGTYGNSYLLRPWLYEYIGTDNLNQAIKQFSLAEVRKQLLAGTILAFGPQPEWRERYGMQSCAVLTSALNQWSEVNGNFISTAETMLSNFDKNQNEFKLDKTSPINKFIAMVEAARQKILDNPFRDYAKYIPLIRLTTSVIAMSNTPLFKTALSLLEEQTTLFLEAPADKREEINNNIHLLNEKIKIFAKLAANLKILNLQDKMPADLIATFQSASSSGTAPSQLQAYIEQLNSLADKINLFKKTFETNAELEKRYPSIKPLANLVYQQYQQLFESVLANSSLSITDLTAFEKLLGIIDECCKSPKNVTTLGLEQAIEKARNSELGKKLSDEFFKPITELQNSLLSVSLATFISSCLNNQGIASKQSEEKNLAPFEAEYYQHKAQWYEKQAEILSGMHIPADNSKASQSINAMLSKEAIFLQIEKELYSLLHEIYLYPDPKCDQLAEQVKGLVVNSTDPTVTDFNPWTEINKIKKSLKEFNTALVDGETPKLAEIEEILRLQAGKIGHDQSFEVTDELSAKSEAITGAINALVLYQQKKITASTLQETVQDCYTAATLIPHSSFLKNFQASLKFKPALSETARTLKTVTEMLTKILPKDKTPSPTQPVSPKEAVSPKSIK